MLCLSGRPGPCRRKALKRAQRFHGKGAGAHRNEEFPVKSQGTKEAATSSNWSCLCRINTALEAAGEREGSSFWKEIHCFQMCYSAKIFFFLGKRRRLPAMIQNSPRHFVKPSHYPLHLGQLLFQQIGNTHQHLLVSHPLFLMSSKSYV